MAFVTVTPATVHAGEQVKIEGTGFALDSVVSVSVDGDEVGTATTRPSPEGGVADFYTILEAPGEYEVEMSESGRGGEKASCDVEVLGQYPEAEVEQPPGRATAPAKARMEEGDKKEAKKEEPKKKEEPTRGTQTPQFRSRK